MYHRCPQFKSSDQLLIAETGYKSLKEEFLCLMNRFRLWTECLSQTSDSLLQQLQLSLHLSGQVFVHLALEVRSDVLHLLRPEVC